MARTITEEVMAKLNYNLTSRLSTSPENRRLNNNYSSAIEGLIDVYARQSEASLQTENDLEEFQEYVDATKYMDNHDLYPEIDGVPVYCASRLATIKQNVNASEMVR
jgi:hypothetical protein